MPGNDALVPITNIEIADCLLRAGKPVTIRELKEIIKLHHPGMVINDTTFISVRLAAFERSKNVVCLVNKDVRPATFHMKTITQEFFRGSRNGLPLDFTHTVIPKKSRSTRSATAFVNELWNSLVRQRLTTC